MKEVKRYELPVMKQRATMLSDATSRILKSLRDILKVSSQEKKFVTMSGDRC